MNKKAKSGPTFNIEAGLCYEKELIIAGVDEAGRGALAGPLGVGLVIFNNHYFKNPLPDEFKKINDSKLLSAEKRNIALQVIKKYAQVYLYKSVSPAKIDSININMATKYAIEKLLKLSPITPDILLLDGNFKFSFEVHSQSIKQGDKKSLSIAAASIVAKVLRDKKMDDYALKYPRYQFNQHKGYGTALHRKIICEQGGTEIHRKSYEPLKSLTRHLLL